MLQRHTGLKSHGLGAIDVPRNRGRLERFRLLLRGVWMRGDAPRRLEGAAGDPNAGAGPIAVPGLRIRWVRAEKVIDREESSASRFEDSAGNPQKVFRCRIVEFRFQSDVHGGPMPGAYLLENHSRHRKARHTGRRQRHAQSCRNQSQHGRPLWRILDELRTKEIHRPHSRRLFGHRSQVAHLSGKENERLVFQVARGNRRLRSQPVTGG